MHGAGQPVAGRVLAERAEAAYSYSRPLSWVLGLTSLNGGALALARSQQRGAQAQAAVGSPCLGCSLSDGRCTHSLPSRVACRIEEAGA